MRQLKHRQINDLFKVVHLVSCRAKDGILTLVPKTALVKNNLWLSVMSNKTPGRSLHSCVLGFFREALIIRKQVRLAHPLGQVCILPLSPASLRRVIKDFYPFQNKLGFIYQLGCIYICICVLYTYVNVYMQTYKYRYIREHRNTQKKQLTSV